MNDTRRWRIGTHYNIHVYAENGHPGHDVPIATALTVSSAKQIVRDHNDAIDQADFLAASVAVWREIDSIYATGTYEGIGGSTALRVAERAAWEQYKRTLDGAR